MYADTIFVTYGKWSDYCAFDLTADLGQQDDFSLVKTGQRPPNTEISRGAAEHRDRRRLRRIRKRYRDRSQQERRLRLWSMNTMEIEWAQRSCSEFDDVFAAASCRRIRAYWWSTQIRLTDPVVTGCASVWKTVMENISTRSGNRQLQISNAI